MELNPFYRPVHYRSEKIENKLKIVEAAKELGKNSLFKYILHFCTIYIVVKFKYKILPTTVLSPPKLDTI